MFKTLNESTTKTGQVVEGQGKPLSHEMMFQMLEKIEEDFPEGPYKSNLVAVIPPELAERVAALEAEYQNSPELQRRHKEILERKYEKFRAREMDRNMAG